jgi:hypothetical protein
MSELRNPNYRESLAWESINLMVWILKAVVRSSICKEKLNIVKATKRIVRRTVNNAKGDHIGLGLRGS